MYFFILRKQYFLANFVKKNPFDLNIFLSHMKYGRKIIIVSFYLVRHITKVVFVFYKELKLNEYWIYLKFHLWTVWWHLDISPFGWSEVGDHQPQTPIFSVSPKWKFLLPQSYVIQLSPLHWKPSFRVNSSPTSAICPLKPEEYQKFNHTWVRICLMKSKTFFFWFQFFASWLFNFLLCEQSFLLAMLLGLQTSKFVKGTRIIAVTGLTDSLRTIQWAVSSFSCDCSYLLWNSCFDLPLSADWSKKLLAKLWHFAASNLKSPQVNKFASPNLNLLRLGFITDTRIF